MKGQARMVVERVQKVEGKKKHKRKCGSAVASVSWVAHFIGSATFSKISKSPTFMHELIKLPIAFHL